MVESIILVVLAFCVCVLLSHASSLKMPKHERKERDSDLYSNTDLETYLACHAYPSQLIEEARRKKELRKKYPHTECKWCRTKRFHDAAIREALGDTSDPWDSLEYDLWKLCPECAAIKRAQITGGKT